MVAWAGLLWLRISDRWQTFVDEVMQLLVPLYVGDFLTSLETVSFPRRTVFYRIRLKIVIL